ncbi:hypothetical protein SAMN04487934_105179 [Eubacterium ruminantium]|nr:hypothetical protein SAMN04487934_105179 [Eubacterium ruminantium]
MKKKKTVGIILITLIMVLMITGCSKYKSQYNAVGFVHSNTSKSAFMDFYSFKGQMVFTVKCKDGGSIDYSAKLEKGNLTVYYDCDGTKQELLRISGGEKVSSSLENLPKGEVYIIVKTDGKCTNGALEFDVRK